MTKLISFFLVLFTFLLLTSCSEEKYTPEQVACYYKKCCEFIEKYNNQEDLQKAGEVIARTCGFREEIDVQPALAEYLGNPEVKKWYDKYNQLITKNTETKDENLEEKLLEAFPDAEKTE